MHQVGGRGGDSNSLPSVLETAIQPNELHTHTLEHDIRFELMIKLVCNPLHSELCYANALSKLAGPAGIEPASTDFQSVANPSQLGTQVFGGCGMDSNLRRHKSPGLQPGCFDRLHTHPKNGLKLAPRAGIEPATIGFSIRHSTN